MEMEYRKVKLDTTAKEIRVYLLNDLHFGSKAADLDLWDRIKKDIRKHKDHARIIINGDIIEGALKTSKGDIYEQLMSPEKQIEFAANELMEFRELIDMVIIGNHDVRILNETSIDPIKYLCRMLDIEDKYVGYEGVLSYSWNKCFYTIQAHHGSGGAASTGAIENKMKKMRKTNCDVFYMGHHHREVAVPYIEYQIDPYNGKLAKKKRWLVCGNTITDFAEYAKKFGYDEKFPSQAVLVMSGDKKNRGIEVEWIRSL